MFNNRDMEPASPSSTPTKPDADAVNSHSNPDQPAAELPRLPPELWTLIFQHLGPFCLSRVRLTCTTWRDIVASSSALMDKFCLHLHRADFEASRPELCKLLASGGGFKRASIEYLEPVGNYECWRNWPTFGEGLTTLSIVGCSIAIFDLVELLRKTPNLNSLVYSDDESEGGEFTSNIADFEMLEACTDFHLRKLEEFSFYSYCRNLDAEVLHFLSKLCPRVRILNIVSGQRDLILSDYFSNTVVSFVNQIRQTLCELEFVPSSEALEQLATISELKLNKLTLDASEVDIMEIVRFLRSQPDIEHLYLLKNQTTSTAELLKMNRRLPNLRSFKMNDKVDLPPALFRKLESLQLRYDESHDPGDFDFFTVPGFDLPRLKRFEIVNCCWQSQALPDFFRLCPNIRSARLVSTFEDLTDIFRAIKQACSLEDLDIQLARVDRLINPEEITFDLYGSAVLRTLEIGSGRSDLPDNLLVTMFKLYPNLTELYLGFLPRAEAIYRGICQHLKKLKILAICGCRKSKKGCITESCSPAELVVVCCYRAELAQLAACAAKEALPIRHVPCAFMDIDRVRPPWCDPAMDIDYY